MASAVFLSTTRIWWGTATGVLGYTKFLHIGVFDDNEVLLWHAAEYEDGEDMFVRYCMPPCAEISP